MNNLHDTPADEARLESGTSHPEHRSGRPGDDVVRWSEFRLALWMGGIALAAILGSQGFLYSAIMGLQGDMHAQFTDMHIQFGELRERVHEVSERVARIETRLDVD
ncbi:MAG: hypothetical protein OXN26_06885 [Gammaproteobacteria bacterium]|nr:hypothetical protein [Gammaproteobacteria bacterium]